MSDDVNYIDAILSLGNVQNSNYGEQKIESSNNESYNLYDFSVLSKQEISECDTNYDLYDEIPLFESNTDRYVIQKNDIASENILFWTDLDNIDYRNNVNDLLVPQENFNNYEPNHVTYDNTLNESNLQSTVNNGYSSNGYSWRTYTDNDDNYDTNNIKNNNTYYNYLNMFTDSEDKSAISMKTEKYEYHDKKYEDIITQRINQNRYDNGNNDIINFSESSFLNDNIANSSDYFNNDEVEMDVNVEINLMDQSEVIGKRYENSFGSFQTNRNDVDNYAVFSEADLEDINSEQGQSQSYFSKLKNELREAINDTLSQTINSTTNAIDYTFKYTIMSIMNNPQVASATNLASEAMLSTAERIRYLTEEFLYTVTSDDPETQYLKELRDSILGGGWKSLLRVYQRHATLTKQQRQLIGIREDNAIIESIMNNSIIENLIFPINIDLKTLIERAENSVDDDDCDAECTLCRYLIPPKFQESNICYVCNLVFNRPFSRHHCRCCGLSVCNDHSLQRRRVLHFGITSHVRVCNACADKIDLISANDHLNWKSTRVRDYLAGNLLPYQPPPVDRTIDKVYRVSDYLLQFVKNTLYLSMPAKLAVETIDIIKNYGKSGFAGVLLRQDFVEAVETLKKISGMEKEFPMSLHELTACIYYKLAVDRFIRGCYPEDEHLSHSPFSSDENDKNVAKDFNLSSKLSSINGSTIVNDYIEDSCIDQDKKDSKTIKPTNYNDSDLKDAVKFAPLALKAAYLDSLVESQLLARLLGWELIYGEIDSAPEKPAYSLFGTDVRSLPKRTRNNSDKDINLNHGLGNLPNNFEKSKSQKIKSSKEKLTHRKEIVLAIRGTSSIHDVVTDIRASPMEFPPSENSENFSNSSEAWVIVSEGKNYACGGMVRAALWLKNIVGPSLIELSSMKNCDIFIVGHSLGGGVAALLTYLMKASIPAIRCITYGCPSCVTAEIADELKDFVLSVVLHDDVISRITPKSIRMFINDLMIFRGNVFDHLQNDWNDVVNRAGSLWSPKWRDIKPKDKILFDHYDSDDDFEHVEIDSLNSSLPHFRQFSRCPQTDNAKEIDLKDDIVFVEGEEIMDIWLPGRIMHIYSHRGLYKAMMVDRTFSSLRKIELQGNMFTDHSCESIMNALHEVIAVKGAKDSPPPWTPYHEAETCKCCDNKFTWHSTFQGIAQEYREKYNCRYCGSLVCDPCSSNKKPIAKFGLIFPSRICDKCDLKGEYATVS